MGICGRFARKWEETGADFRDPTYRKAVKGWGPLQKRVDDAKFENDLRHGQWKTLALWAQEADWNDGVYYWRQHGGLESVWRIGAGGIERQLREKEMLPIFWRFLPYPDRESFVMR